jgi:hypothetical protein
VRRSRSTSQKHFLVFISVGVDRKCHITYITSSVLWLLWNCMHCTVNIIHCDLNCAVNAVNSPIEPHSVKPYDDVPLQGKHFYVYGSCTELAAPMTEVPF